MVRPLLVRPLPLRATSMSRAYEQTYLVTVSGYDEARFVADTSGKARYRAFLAFREAFGDHISFRDFLARGVKVAVEVCR